MGLGMIMDNALVHNNANIGHFNLLVFTHPIVICVKCITFNFIGLYNIRRSSDCNCRAGSSSLKQKYE